MQALARQHFCDGQAGKAFSRGNSFCEKRDHGKGRQRGAILFCVRMDLGIALPALRLTRILHKRKILGRAFHGGRNGWKKGPVGAFRRTKLWNKKRV
jgi:hypothetical protein